MKPAVKFCCVFVTVVLAGTVHGENKCAQYVYSGDGRNRLCPPQLEREKARQIINSCIRNSLGIISQSNAPNCGPGLWHRVAYINTSDSSQQCPSAWIEYSTSGLRACGRQSGVACSSVNFTTNGFRYRKVCGQVIGYQLGSTDVFDNQNRSIDSAYVDGVSITHGTPRTHIWTYAAGEHDDPINRYDCPCLVDGNGFTPQIPPPYVGDDYYCESGNHYSSGYPDSLTDTNDLLWDGKQCEGQCCSNGKSPPWFSVDLPNPTSDDIEVRLCDTDNLAGEDTPIKLLEIYIQT